MPISGSTLCHMHTAERLCGGCGEPLEPSRRNRRYHGPRCRKAAYLRRQHERETAESVPTPGLDPQAVLAEATSEPRLLIYVAQAARSNWRAAAWLLERRWPERWARGGESELAPPTDPLFAEVDELADRRRSRTHDRAP